jgi:hypothetical protein
MAIAERQCGQAQRRPGKTASSGSIRTLGFDGDVAELRKLMAARLAFADTVHV